MPITAAKSTTLFRATTNEEVVVLSNSSWARKLDFGTSWNSLRVGVLVQSRHLPTSPNNIPFLGNDETAGPRFGFGLCSGTTPPTKLTAGHWAGALTTGASWLESDQGGQSYVMAFTSMAPFKKVGASFSGAANFAGVAPTIGATALKPAGFLRTMLFVDIVKGSPNYGFKLFASGSVHTAGDRDRATFLTQMEAQPPSSSGYVYTAEVSLAVNEAVDGIFDSVGVFYERTGPEIEISDVALARLT